MKTKLINDALKRLDIKNISTIHEYIFDIEVNDDLYFHINCVCCDAKYIFLYNFEDADIINYLCMKCQDADLDLSNKKYIKKALKQINILCRLELNQFIKKTIK